MPYTITNRTNSEISYETRILQPYGTYETTSLLDTDITTAAKGLITITPSANYKIPAISAFTGPATANVPDVTATFSQTVLNTNFATLVTRINEGDTNFVALVAHISDLQTILASVQAQLFEVTRQAQTINSYEK